ncbi:MAG: hydrogenase, partial [Chloroflexi bacterium]|nr:hydrogenase [Chloroflexota bacterium]
KLTILWAARSPSLLIFREEFDDWRAAPNTELFLTVDQGDESWKGNVGLITDLLKKVAPSPENAVAVTCGPPIMLRFVTLDLARLGFAPEQMIMTLEAKMKCGLGKCGRCNLGEKFVCTDGPVFSYAEVRHFLESH